MPTGADGMRLVGLPGHLKTIEVRLLIVDFCFLHPVRLLHLPTKEVD